MNARAFFAAALTMIHFLNANAGQDWRSKAIAEVRPGAIVARRGLDSDQITQLVLRGQGSGRWSHVGVAVQLIPGGTVYIESAMPGSGTRLEKPEVFFSREQASDGAVFQVPLDKTDAVQSAAQELLGRPFDNELQLDDNGQKLYCTELAALALIKADVIQEMPARKALFVPWAVITPDDLIASLSAQ